MTIEKWSFFFIFAFVEKEYDIWGLDCWDDSIGENNAAGSCLTKEFAECQEFESREYGHPVWISGSYKLKLKEILKHVWNKDEVDQFVELHPETSLFTFKIYNSKPFRKHLEYNSIGAKRNELIKSILYEN